MSDGPAVRFARARRSWEPLDWWKLEAHALHEDAELRRAIAFFAPAEAWRALSKDTVRAWGCLLTLSHIASFVFPLLAAGAVVGWLFAQDEGLDLRIPGSIAAIAAVLAAIGLVIDHRDPSGVDPKVGRLLGMLHLGPSAAATAVAGLALAQGEADFGFAALGLLADAVVGALHSAVYRGPADAGSDRWRRNLARLDAAVSGLAEADRGRIQADIADALDVLDERELVPAAELERARGVRIGLLGISMAPREDLVPAPAAEQGG
ncbi:MULTISPECIES: hypothetical protein [Microbacterium]|uniref:SLATT domain-containing protein n=1 Tax=Microbacterium wangchenii TaxID=2541726 RepID=A0ABX5SWD0_9MICO|nr:MULTISPECIES: hypothetical protein [Microbacterium]MCK6067510.1 hypothetical protein [Microbacterium sp. EYE_512]QBR89560.1 hypothetical protein E4K62_13260 [Microbacterium wangchenii]TXK16842.1 hypothetical protein FVP99_09255 [Microbacterium wangchenii]